MILTATRGRPFSEEFNFKDENGEEMHPPRGKYSLVLEHSPAVLSYDNLLIQGKVVWSLDADETAALPYNLMYFVLTYNGEEITRGVLRVE
jgi:hypothetical protein